MSAPDEGTSVEISCISLYIESSLSRLIVDVLNLRAATFQHAYLGRQGATRPSKGNNKVTSLLTQLIGVVNDLVNRFNTEGPPPGSGMRQGTGNLPYLHCQPYYITDYMTNNERSEQDTLSQDIFSSTKSLGSNAMSFVLQSVKSRQVGANEAAD